MAGIPSCAAPGKNNCCRFGWLELTPRCILLAILMNLIYQKKTGASAYAMWVGRIRSPFTWSENFDSLLTVGFYISLENLILDFLWTCFVTSLDMVKILIRVNVLAARDPRLATRTTDTTVATMISHPKVSFWKWWSKKPEVILVSIVKEVQTFFCHGPLVSLPKLVR